LYAISKQSSGRSSSFIYKKKAARYRKNIDEQARAAQQGKGPLNKGKMQILEGGVRGSVSSQHGCCFKDRSAEWADSMHESLDCLVFAESRKNNGIVEALGREALRNRGIRVCNMHRGGFKLVVKIQQVACNSRTTAK
jgi:hypothetical protein